MTDYVDNMKKSIVAAQETLVQKIHDEIERVNAAYREAIIRMAQEAGARPSNNPEQWDVWLFQAPAMEHFADLVAAEERKALKEELRRDMEEICSLREAEESLREENEQLRAALTVAAKVEREACAKVCEEWGAWNSVAQDCAKAIRARGNYEA